jgi:hypothetical protein
MTNVKNVIADIIKSNPVKFFEDIGSEMEKTTSMRNNMLGRLGTSTPRTPT